MLNNALFLAIVVSVLVYFLFAFEQRNRAVRGTAQFGRWVLMFSFGAIFGSTIMTRMALLIDRMYFLFHDWLRLVPRLKPFRRRVDPDGTGYGSAGAA